MWFKTVVVLSVFSAVLAVTNETNRESYVSYKKKYYGELYKKFERANDLENARRSEEYAGEALSGVYSECLVQVSFSCLQKKVLNFINRMNRMEKFSLLGNYVSVVRTKNDYEPEAEFQARLNKEEDSGLDDLVDDAIDRFFNNHIIRVKIPNAFAVLKNPENRNYEEATALDFRFPYVDETEGRKKKGGGGKMGKKMMMMMMSGLKTKLMLMGPMMMGMAGMMSLKAIMMSLMALMISKVMLIKKLMMMKNKGGNGGGGGGWDNGGGGGGPWSSGGGSGGGGGPWSSGGGGGGGWDRRNMQDRWDASTLAYRAYTTVENLF